MGRLPSSAVQGSGLKKGPWTPEEDEKLMDLVAIARSLSGPSHNNSVSSASNPLEIITTELAKIQMVQKLIQLIGTNTPVVDNGGYDALTRRPYSSLESQNMITTGANYPNMINIHLAENSWASSGSGTAQLPSLWPSCSKVSTESTPITSRLSAEPNASINVFEDLEKLMEDDTCASFLRDLLDE
ncbi:hypothetical protein SAY86_013351 [Trapa natans]|uniref:HTH myb-type domain-containing protein n=1 Tax=Trapa natans TaxID=22666 RepID=A0AAN7LZM3_TRANT|nr:hypothetical protein SAY86_013351 [Trapa natans]